MLSLLPPLKTREISPRYTYNVSTKVKGKFKTGSTDAADEEPEIKPRK